MKVFGRKDSSTSSAAGSSSSSYLARHFSDVRSQAAGTAADAAHKTFQKQKELEKLLMKAENDDISMLLALNISTAYLIMLQSSTPP